MPGRGQSRNRKAPAALRACDIVKKDRVKKDRVKKTASTIACLRRQATSPPFRSITPRLRNMDAPTRARRVDRSGLPGRRLTVGLGFRRDVSLDQIDDAVRTALGPHGSIADVVCVATLRAKAREPALLAFCGQHRVPLVALPMQAISACFDENPSLARSPAARAHAGVEGVCEPCALLAAPGARLLQGKQVRNGVTVAIGALAPMPDNDGSRKQGTKTS